MRVQSRQKEVRQRAVEERAATCWASWLYLRTPSGRSALLSCGRGHKEKDRSRGKHQKARHHLPSTTRQEEGLKDREPARRTKLLARTFQHRTQDEGVKFDPWRFRFDLECQETNSPTLVMTVITRSVSFRDTVLVNSSQKVRTDLRLPHDSSINHQHKQAHW